MSTQPFLAEIMMFGGNFAPTRWAQCNGQLLPINQNTALFSLLGTTYGGDGLSNFALPNLQDRVPLHSGQGQGLPQRNLGETGGGANFFSASTAAAPVSPIQAITFTGGATASPFLVLTFVIALQGVFPPRP